MRSRVVHRVAVAVPIPDRVHLKAAALTVARAAPVAAVVPSARAAPIAVAAHIVDRAVHPAVAVAPSADRVHQVEAAVADHPAGQAAHQAEAAQALQGQVQDVKLSSLVRVGVP